LSLRCCTGQPRVNCVPSDDKEFSLYDLAGQMTSGSGCLEPKQPTSPSGHLQHLDLTRATVHCEDSLVVGTFVVRMQKEACTFRVVSGNEGDEFLPVAKAALYC
jgi:hypothetical protein